jgi:hypothetical protein
MAVVMFVAAPAQSAEHSQSTVTAHPPRPGSINYVEGNACIGTENLGPNSPGSVEIEKGQTLTTEAGKVEILLTPGVFLRVADNSSIRMISPSLANTAVAVEKGRAAVEVLDIAKENDIRVSLDDTNTRILSKGLYEFDAGEHQVRVFKGKADVYVGDQKVTLTAEHELGVNATGKLKSEGFDARKYEDEFFRWSALRSGYLSEASVDQARFYIGYGPAWYGPLWYGPGWYWNPNFFVYTFLPAYGVFYSPFGWGFYSPIVVYRSPFFYWGFGSGPHRFSDFHYPYGHGFEPRGGFHGGGFHTAPRGRS